MKSPNLVPDPDALQQMLGGMAQTMTTLNHLGHAAYVLQFALKGLLDVANLPESTASYQDVEKIARQYHLVEVEASGDYEALMEAMIARATNALAAATLLLPSEKPPAPAVLDWSLPYGEAMPKYLHDCFRERFHGFLPSEAEIKRLIEDVQYDLSARYDFEAGELSITPDERDVASGVHLGRAWTYGAIWNDALLADYEAVAAEQRAKQQQP